MNEEYQKQCSDCQCRPPRPDCPPPYDPCYNNNGSWIWILVLILVFCVLCNGNGNDGRGGLFGGLF